MSPILQPCPKCGREVPPDAPAELCPSCLFRGAFSHDSSMMQSKSGSTLHIVIPEESSASGRRAQTARKL
jgi:NMD protein affecting ribosome stability and mRNA decay